MRPSCARAIRTFAFATAKVGAFEPDGGIVFPEKAVAAHLALAKAHGATTIEHVTMTSWEAGDSVRVTLSNGSCVEAASAVFTLGPWFAAEMQRIGVPLVVQRNVQLWFSPESADWYAAHFPAFLIERSGQPLLYGFPDLGEGVKAAFHASGETTSPDGVRRDVGDDDVDPVARALEAWMPGAARKLVAAKVCMYSLTPDRNFVVGLHPRHRNVVVCGGFSGHGFKFASVVRRDRRATRARRRDGSQRRVSFARSIRVDAREQGREIGSRREDVAGRRQRHRNVVHERRMRDPVVAERIADRPRNRALFATAVGVLCDVTRVVADRRAGVPVLQRNHFDLHRVYVAVPKDNRSKVRR